MRDAARELAQRVELLRFRKLPLNLGQMLLRLFAYLFATQAVRGTEPLRERVSR